MRCPRALPAVIVVCLLPLGLLGLSTPPAYGQVRGPSGLIGIGFTRGGSPGFGFGPGFGFARALASARASLSARASFFNAYQGLLH
jgi:hypothetical protein